MTPLDIRANQRQRAEVLRASPMRLQVITHDIMRQLIDSAQDEDGNRLRVDTDCRAGCDHCCYLYVTALPSEIEAITDYLKHFTAPEMLARIRARIDAAHVMTRDMTPAQRAGAGIPCPLLVNNCCIAYPVRPMACAGWSSIDAATCERVAQGSGEQVTRDELRWFVFRALFNGTNDTLKDAGGAYGPLELVEALRAHYHGGDIMAARVVFDEAADTAVKERQIDMA